MQSPQEKRKPVSAKNQGGYSMPPEMGEYEEAVELNPCPNCGRKFRADVLKVNSDRTSSLVLLYCCFTLSHQKLFFQSLHTRFLAERDRDIFTESQKREYETDMRSR
eukprot:1334519-Amorphochlora_amoeboformis.AAC.1